MKMDDRNWMQIEEYLKRDDRVVLPLGSTEQHAYLSLSTDSILAERVSVDAAQPLGIPVLPVFSYGITPYFRSFPGSITLRVETYIAVVRDILDNLRESGFRRILIVNGHGGNTPVGAYLGEWMADNTDCRVKFHNWWNAPLTWAKVTEIDPVASHASWMENFPWTRLAGVTMPEEQKPMFDPNRIRPATPAQVRAYLGDGNYGGLYQRSDVEMMAIWDVAVAETRALLTESWNE